MIWSSFDKCNVTICNAFSAHNRPNFLTFSLSLSFVMLSVDFKFQAKIKLRHVDMETDRSIY